LCLALPLLVSAQPVSAEVVVTDDAGREVVLEAPARRVIALYGAFNEILAAMGLEETIVARTRADHKPAVIRSRPVIGTHLRPNVEMVVGLSPDLVLQMGGRKQAGEPLAALERYGVPVAHFNAASFAELFSVIRRLGVLTGAEPRAAELVENMRERLARVEKRLDGTKRPDVFFEVRYPNLLGAGRCSMVDDVIRRAGGANCLEAEDKLVRLSEEELLRLDPDAYLLQRGPMNPNPVPPAERPHFRTLAAVEKGRVMLVDEQLFSRPGPRSVEAVEALAGFLHPERFTNAAARGDE
jgi:iron complex transport system substrate-binding protein